MNKLFLLLSLFIAFFPVTSKAQATVFPSAGVFIAPIDTSKLSIDSIYTLDGHGNSLTQGYGTSDAATKNWVYVLAHTSPYSNKGITFYNDGYSGYTTEQLYGNFLSVVQPHYVSGKRNVLVFWEGGNDIFLNGNVRTATAMYDSIVAYCNQARAYGWYVIVVTIPYRDDTGTGGAVVDNATYQDMRLAINSNIVSNYRHFANGICDLAADSRLQSYSTTYYWTTDHTHLNDAGQVVVAGLIGVSLGSIYKNVLP